MRPLHVITGALGYTGRSIAERLMDRDVRLRTLTNSPERPNPFGERLEIQGYHFGEPNALARSLEGAEVLYNTYWVRFNHRLFSFDEAVENTCKLFEAARRAGVERIVHVSILQAREADDLGYYMGKHKLEIALEQLGVSHAIVRPGVLFGRGDILVNNIAWVLRHMPIFGVFGSGEYGLRPMHVDDMAELMIRLGGESTSSITDAVGPERFTYRELVQRIGEIMQVRRPIVSVPAWLGYGISRVLNPFLHDVMITREEIAGLMRGLLDSEAASPPEARTRLTEWAGEHAAELGRRYASEVARRVHRDVGYEQL